MRNAAFLLVLFLSPDVWALRKITPDEKADIQLAMDEAARFGGQIDQEQRTWDRARRSGDPTAVAAFEAKIAALTVQRNTAYNKAIWKTINYYEILNSDQELPQGVIVRKGVREGQQETWVPTFADHTPKVTIDSTGQHAEMEKFPFALGVTGVDGVSYIFPDAFDYPAKLALVIIHEKTHFEQFVTKGVGDVLTPNQLEIQAFQKGKALINGGKFDFPSDDEKERLSDAIDRNISSYTMANQFDRFRVAMGDPIVQRDVRPNVDAELARIRTEALGLRAQVEREQGESRNVGNQDQTDIKTEDALQILRRTAQSICLLVGHSWGQKERGDYNKACGMLADKPELIAPGSASGGLDGCQRQVTEVLVRCKPQDEAEPRTQAIAGPSTDQVNLIIHPIGPPPATSDSSQAVATLQRIPDKKELTRLYQEILDVCANLCLDSSKAWDQYDVLCDVRRKISVIEDKYVRRGESAPNDVWNDVRSDDCAWEFWHDIRDNYKGMCFGDNGDAETRSANWFKGKAEGLNQKYHPPQTPAPSLGGGHGRGGDDRGGSDGCPEGTHRIPGGPCGRKPNDP